MWFSLCLSCYLILVRIRQSLGGLCGVGQLDEEAQRVSLTVAGGIMLSQRLVELRALLAAPRVAELVVAQRGLQVACKINGSINPSGFYSQFLK